VTCPSGVPLTSWRRFVTLAIAPMMGVRTPRIPAAPRAGRSGIWHWVWSWAPASTRRSERTTLSTRGLASRSWQRPGPPASGSTSSRRWRTPCSIRGSCHRGPAPRRSTCPLGWVEEIGRQLSERSCATASAVAGSLSEDVLARLLLSDTLWPTQHAYWRRHPVSHPSPRSPPTGGSSGPQARRCDVGRKHGRDL
jgi:hypothetical protein